MLPDFFKNFFILLRCLETMRGYTRVAGGESMREEEDY